MGARATVAYFLEAFYASMMATIPSPKRIANFTKWASQSEGTLSASSKKGFAGSESNLGPSRGEVDVYPIAPLRHGRSKLAF